MIYAKMVTKLGDLTVPVSVVELEPRAEVPTFGSYLFITGLKKYYRKKIMVAEDVFVNCYNF